MHILGLDIGKANFDACLLVEAHTQHARFANTEAGFAQLGTWLAQHRGRCAGPLHACMEATGNYGLELAASLFAQGDTVSIVNPRQIKAFSEAELARNKTDRLDAALIARFCRAQNPAPWTPPAPHMRELRELVRRCGALKNHRTQERNRLQAGLAATTVRASIERMLEHIDAEIRSISNAILELIAADPQTKANFDLLCSIPGIATVAAAVLLAELPNIAEFTPKGLAAFAGLSPAEHSSGERQHSSGISRIGNAALRRTLYLSALSARRANPPLVKFADRLKSAGKPNKVILIAVARKLLVLAHAVIRNQSPFNPGLDLANTRTA